MKRERERGEAQEKKTPEGLPSDERVTTQELERPELGPVEVEQAESEQVELELAFLDALPGVIPIKTEADFEQYLGGQEAAREEALSAQASQGVDGQTKDKRENKDAIDTDLDPAKQLFFEAKELEAEPMDLSKLDPALLNLSPADQAFLPEALGMSQGEWMDLGLNLSGAASQASEDDLSQEARLASQQNQESRAKSAQEVQKLMALLKSPWFSSYDPGVPIHYRYHKHSLYERVEQTWLKQASAIALSRGGVQIRGEVFLQEIHKAARAFHQLGVSEGTRVAFVLEASPAFVILFYAALRQGALVLPIDPELPEQRMQKALMRMNARLLIADERFYLKNRPFLKRLAPAYLITVQGDEYHGYSALPSEWVKKLKGFQTQEDFDARFNAMNVIRLQDLGRFDLSAHRIPKTESAQNQEARPSVVILDTERDKAPQDAFYTPQMMSVFAQQMPALLGILELSSLRVAALFPYHHIFGLSFCMHAPLVNGMTLIFDAKDEQKTRLYLHEHSLKSKETKRRQHRSSTRNEEAPKGPLRYKLESTRLSPARSSVALVHRSKPEVIIADPSFYAALVHTAGFERVDYSRLKAALVIGERIRGDLKAAVDRHFKKHGAVLRLREGYTTGGCAAFVTLNPQIANKSGSAGVPVADTWVHILDPQTKEPCRVGAVGEIYVSSPALAKRTTLLDLSKRRKFSLSSGSNALNESSAHRAPDEASEVRSNASALERPKETLDPELHATGDLGFVSGAGYLYFASHKARHKKVYHVTVDLDRLEEELRRFDEVKEVFALSRTHAVMSNELCVVLLVSETLYESPTAQQKLIERMVAHLEYHFGMLWVPSFIELYQEWPDFEATKDEGEGMRQMKEQRHVNSPKDEARDEASDEESKESKEESKESKERKVQDHASEREMLRENLQTRYRSEGQHFAVMPR